MHYGDLLQSIVTELEPLRGSGEVADYIPPLKRVDPKQFGIALMTVDGDMHVAGDADTRFSIQSISKVFALTLAMQHARDDLWNRLGREPSGTRFNSLVQLEHERGIPRNPFINAGALVVTDAILEALADAKGTFLDLVRDLSGAADAGFDLEVAQGEKETGFTNTAMAWFIKSFGNLHADPEAVLDAYFHHCAMALSCRELARAGIFLANGGCTLDGTCMLSPQHTKRVNALMMTCGAYDAVGDFAFRVGLPAKSGVGGGILAVLPQYFSVCVWSPGLDATGNSLLGIRALELLTERSGLSVF
jgi:glutaminase